MYHSSGYAKHHGDLHQVSIRKLQEMHAAANPARLRRASSPKDAAPPAAAPDDDQRADDIAAANRQPRTDNPLDGGGEPEPTTDNLPNGGGDPQPTAGDILDALDAEAEEEGEGDSG